MKYKYIECPAEWTPQTSELSVFLAGGISNCDNWQPRMAQLLSNCDMTVVNPRRSNFDLNSVDMAKKQIEWEHKYLQKVSTVLFWFPSETLCPITLLEYGKWMVREKKIFLGIHPEYKRKLDLEVQTLLEVGKEIQPVYNLEDLANQVIDWQKGEL